MMTEELKRKAIYIIHNSKGIDRQELNYDLFNAGFCVNEISELTGQPAVVILGDIRSHILNNCAVDSTYADEARLVRINEFFNNHEIVNPTHKMFCAHYMMGYIVADIAYKFNCPEEAVNKIIDLYFSTKSQKKEEEKKMSMKIDEIKEARARLVNYISDNLGDEIRSTYEDFDDCSCTEREFLYEMKKLSDKYDALFKDLDDLTNELKETKAKLESIKEFTNKEV